MEIDPEQLSRIFAVPQWLRDLGLMSWLVVGSLVLLGGTVWLLSLTSIIVIPVITATIIAAVLSPVVGWLARAPAGPRRRRGDRARPRDRAGRGGRRHAAGGRDEPGAGAQEDACTAAVDKAQGWLQDAGVSTSKSKDAGDDASKSVSDGFHALLKGAGAGVEALASLAAFLSFTALSLFFLLKDGPLIRALGRAPHGRPV